MEVMPRDIPVSNDNFSARRVSVNLVTEVAEVALASTAIPVTITAPPGIEISCDATNRGNGSYGSSCTRNSWSFDTHGPRERAAGFFWVRGTPGETSEETHWTIKLTSGGTAKHVEYVTVREFDAIAVEDIVNFQPEGEFQGVLKRAAVGGLATEAMPFQVPVRAWVTATTVDFFDDTYSISPSGWLKIDTTQDLNQELLRLPDSGVGADLATGGIDGMISGSSIARSFNAAKGVLTGTFVISSVGESRWDFSVTSFGGTTCVGANDCSVGEECSQGYCMPTPVWSPGASSEFSEERGARWASSVSTLVSDIVTADPNNNLLERVMAPYSKTRGVAREPGLVPMLGVGTLRESVVDSPEAQAGFQLAAGFDDAFYSIRAAATSLLSVNRVSLQWYVGLISNHDDNLYERLYRPFSRDSFSGDPRATLVPCVDFSMGQAGSDASGVWQKISQSSAYLQTEYRFGCSSLYTNHIAPTEAVSGGYDSFLSTSCVESNYDIRVVEPGGILPPVETSTSVYLCPFMDALWGAPSSRMSSEDELCYQPDSADLLRSGGELKGNLMSISGDLKCLDGTFPRGVNFSHLGDQSESSTDASTVSQILTDCLADLSREPPNFEEATSFANVFEKFGTLYANHHCFSPSNFYGSLQTLTDGMDFSLANWPLGGFGTTTDGASRQRLLSRLLQQWTELHTFVAREGRQVESIAKTLRNRVDLGVLEQSSVDAAPGYEKLLEESERGWQLLLSFNNVVSNFQDEDALLNPDYRPLPMQTSSVDHDQNVGLPVMIMEGLAAHMQLVDEYIRNVQVSTYGNCFQGGGGQEINAALSRARRAMHYANAISRTWGTVVASLSSTPSWNERYEYSQLEFQSARESAWRGIRDLTHCLAPGTISETDVPLFFGDVVGTSSRYFASSDYLLSGWAVPAVQSAISSLNQARSAFISQRNSQLQDQMSEVDAERRLENLSASYGSQIADLCGISEIESSAILSRVALGESYVRPENGINLRDCYIDHANPICSEGLDNSFRPRLEALTAAPSTLGGSTVSSIELTDVQVQFALCRNEHLLPFFGSLAPDVGNFTELDIYDRLSENSRLLTEYVAGRLYKSFPIIRTSDRLGVKTVNGVGDDASIPFGYFLTWEADIGRLANDPASKAIVDAATESCASDPYFAGKSYALTQVENSRLDQSCYRGIIGESISALLTAHTQIEIARAGVEKIGMDIELAENNCEMTMVELEHANEIQVAFDEAQEKRRQMKETADRAFGAISASAGVATGNLSGIGELVKSYYTDMNDRTTDGLALLVTDKDLREEQIAHDHVMALLSIENDYKRCMRIADAPRTAFRGAYLNVQIAQQSAQTAIIRLNNAVSRMKRLAMEGRAAVNREEGRFVASYAHHYWLDEHVDAFERDFSYAKRLTFMAMRAVEYEFQQSLSLRQEILSATSPEQLQDAIVELKQEQVTRTINSRRPEESQLVLSLRDQILLLENSESESGGQGERDWTPTQRFVDRLWSNENAVYDSLGEYLGQGITFNLAPTGELDYRCGERLWSLSATMQGDLLDVDAPNTSLFLIRNNSFGSQWCDGRGEEASMQVGSMQPTSSLFEDDERGGSEAFGLSKITAMLQPWFNVPRSEFYRESYAEGSSEEFAGRGLYGEYTILFPWKGLLEDGFPLERVEDILIRFDYISVDNLTNL